jgi:hypothetical protein
MVAAAVLAVVTGGACAGWGEDETPSRLPTPQDRHCAALITSTQRAMANVTHDAPLKQALIVGVLDNDLPAVRGALVKAGIAEREAAELPIEISDQRRDKSAPVTRVWFGGFCWPEHLVVNIYP